MKSYNFWILFLFASTIINKTQSKVKYSDVSYIKNIIFT